MHVMKSFANHCVTRLFTLLYIAAYVIMFPACQNKSNKNVSETNQNTHPLFSLLPSSQTNITFNNTLVEGPNTNVLMYEYFYNGGGVAIGDINNDGLQDIYFSSNQGSNKLYLNKGNLHFEDITDMAKVAGKGNWKTGVTMADVNDDGLMDIYVCEVG